MGKNWIGDTQRTGGGISKKRCVVLGGEANVQKKGVEGGRDLLALKFFHIAFLKPRPIGGGG